jgi:hypothetical protein
MLDMTVSDQLLAIEAIKRLKARYFRCMDTKDCGSGRRPRFCRTIMTVSGRTGPSR